MKNKGNKRLIIALSVLVGIPTIFNLVSKKRKSDNEQTSDGLDYDFTYGKIRYNVYGEKNTKSIVLVHSVQLGIDSSEWDKNIEELSETYKVYTFDLLGFGESSKPNITYSSYLYTKLISDFVNDVVKTDCTVVASGKSCDFAVMASKFNDKITKLVLTNPIGIIRQDTYNLNSKVTKTVLQSPLYGTFIYNVLSTPTFLKFYLKRYYSDDITDEIATNVSDKYSKLSGHKNLAIASNMTNLLNVNINNHIRNIDIPMLIVWGENNAFNVFDTINEMVKDNSNVTVVNIKDSKLLPQQQNAVEFNRVCKEFI